MLSCWRYWTWKSCIDFKLLWLWFLSGSLHLLVAETCTSILTIIIFDLSRVLTWNSYYIAAEGIPQSKLNLQKILQALQQAFFFEAAFSVPTDSVKASWIIVNLPHSRTLPNEISKSLLGCHEVSAWHHKHKANLTGLYFYYEWMASF